MAGVGMEAGAAGAGAGTPGASRNAGKTLPRVGSGAKGGKGTKRDNRDFKKSGYKRSDNPDVLYGRDFDDEPISIDRIEGEMGEVVIRGKILTNESR